MVGKGPGMVHKDYAVYPTRGKQDEERGTEETDGRNLRSDQWSEEWDGVELRWLLEKAVEYEQPLQRMKDRRMSRYQDFFNHWVTKNLY